MIRKSKKKEKSRQSQSLKPKTVRKTSASRPRKRTAQKQVVKTSLVFKLFMGAIIALLMVIALKYIIEPLISPNPLLGKWRTQTALGIMEIEFDRQSMSSFGTKNPVSYDVEENKVIVFDDTIKVGNTYKIIDQNTISTESGGYKTVYKRVR
ncbi:hypothetical protein Sdiek1_1240 [Sulfurospirillum diekertiae]|uniref:DUF2850 domain-containing protein n=1 Tax=Sulfurospirillum diekertiae TaxID=1854492 RepID=A0A1Y0HLD8_9BACT|nr:hypothetical protein [Sulfurospirillum diekertiae]ARU48406.1 hypothetical protein Sdiek1_1240 [Sulfurospirillum diekertiae]